MFSKVLFIPGLNLALHELFMNIFITFRRHNTMKGEKNLNALCCPAKNTENLLTNSQIGKQTPKL